MVPSFLLILREGLEAALIIGIIFGYISKIERLDLRKHVYTGTILGVFFSIITAFIFNRFTSGFEGRNEQIFEGILMLFAVFILTSMIIWMKKQSKDIKNDLQKTINNAVNNKVYGLVFLAFVSVYREGVEIVLFLEAIKNTDSPLNTAIGSILGIIVAIIIAIMIFKYTVRLDIGKFFKITGLMIIVIAAGLFAHGIHELQEAGIIPIIIEHIYNINGVVDENGNIGSILKAIFGYNGNPSLIEMLSYLTYIVTISLMYNKN
ncbi:MAG: FTR1 family protein [Clostridiaceae bacterium]